MKVEELRMDERVDIDARNVLSAIFEMEAELDRLRRESESYYRKADNVAREAMGVEFSIEMMRKCLDVSLSGLPVIADS